MLFSKWFLQFVIFVMVATTLVVSLPPPKSKFSFNKIPSENVSTESPSVSIVDSRILIDVPNKDDEDKCGMNKVLQAGECKNISSD